MQYAARPIRPAHGTVAVVGLGKIGLPVAACYAVHGWRVLGCDSNPQVVETVNMGKTHVCEEPELAALVPELVSEGRLRATNDTAGAVRQAEVVVVIVPVAIDEEHRVQFAHIDAATAAIGAGLRSGTLVIYETTLPVGTTAGRLRHILESQTGLKAGKEFYLAYSPERVMSGHIFRDLRVYPKVVGGIDADSAFAAASFYRSALEARILTMASLDEAEFVKLIETTYRDVNIALANEYARFADKRRLDIAAAIAAANTQPYAQIHTPGVGVGGHCIPVYPYFLLHGLSETSETDGYPPCLLRLPRVARCINDGMADYAVQRIEAALGSLQEQMVLILGVCYRAEVRETAFTSAHLLALSLRKAGAIVYAHDPLLSDEELREAGFTPLPGKDREQVRAIVLQTAHAAYAEFDFSRFGNCQVVLDGRRALARERVEAVGMRYIAIGDGRSGDAPHSAHNDGKQAMASIAATAEDDGKQRGHEADRERGE